MQLYRMIFVINCLSKRTSIFKKSFSQVNDMQITLTNTGKRYNREWIFRHFNYEFSCQQKICHYRSQWFREIYLTTGNRRSTYRTMKERLI